MRLKTLWLAIVFIILPVVAMAQDNKKALIQELYVKSGLEKQIGQFPLLIQVGFDQATAADNRLKVMPRSIIGEIRASIETVFMSEDIKQTMLGEFSEKLSIDSLKSVLGWLNSPIGRQITQVEEAASTPEKYTEMQQFALQLQKSPPLPERLEIIKHLDSAIKATEASVEVAMGMQLAIAIAIVSSLPREQQPTYDRLAASIEQTRPQVENAMRAQTLVSFLYTYSSLTQEELGRYIAFASSPAGVNYHSAAISGLKEAMLKGSYKWGKIITDILKQSANKSGA